MKPFDLERAKAGDPVCLRSGEPARIICFDKRGDFPIVALVASIVSGTEKLYCYDKRGYKTGIATPITLYMAPIKRQVWVNLYYRSDCAGIDSTVWSCEGEALVDSLKCTDDEHIAVCIKTQLVEWEE